MNFLQLNGDVNPIVSLAESLLVWITDITESIECIQIEQENLFQVGCYLYRASAFIKEVHTTEPSPSNALDILQSLSKGTGLAKNLIEILKKATHPLSEIELRSIISQLEHVIKDMGKFLGSIPSSLFTDQEYAEIAVKSLSKEMQNACFKTSDENQVSKPDDLEKKETDLYAIDSDDAMEMGIEIEMENSQVPVTSTFNATVTLNSSSTRTSQKNESIGNGSTVTLPHSGNHMELLSDSESLNSTRVSKKHVSNGNGSTATLPNCGNHMEPLSQSESLNGTSTRTSNKNISMGNGSMATLPHSGNYVEPLSASESLSSTSTRTSKKNLSMGSGPMATLPHSDNYVERLSASESVNSTSTRTSKKNVSMGSGSIASLPNSGNYMEPLYDAFYCPLTKKLMEDPVTIETGVSFEREAITKWLSEFTIAEEMCCPVTKQRMVSKTLSTNIALKTTIEEWKDRNEVARIKVVRSSLSLGNSPNMILRALDDLHNICQRKEYNKVQVRKVGIIPLLIKMLEYKDKTVRCATLEMLLMLVKDDEGKVMVEKAIDLLKIVKLLSNSHQTVRHATLLFLLELSYSYSLSENFGSVPGGILMLITIKLNQSNDAFASDKAGEILKNLERFPNNVIRMAENGLLDPLLNHLFDGSDDMKIEMGNYLGEVVLKHDTENYIAQTASSALIQMVHSANPVSRKAGFKALKQISSYQIYHGKILEETGLVKTMVEEMFRWRNNNKLMDTSIEATAIVANILESGIALETLQVNSHGHTMGSDYILFNIIHIIKNSAPNELNINLMRILICLAKSTKSRATIVSVIKKTEGSFTLIEFISNPDEGLVTAAIKLLIILTPFIGHTLADRICKTKGLLENLIYCSNETTYITERQAVSADLLAKLPHQNLRLNLALLNKDIVPIILQKIDHMERREIKTSRYASVYLESLVGILVRFTTTLYEPQILSLARNHNFTLKFTELLKGKYSDEVQKLSAIGLENLSSVSVNLSKPPPIKKQRFKKLFIILKFLSFRSMKNKQIPVCPVHRGVCSSQNTFCLVDANVVGRLLNCLEHENVEVAEAALSTICTLMDDKVDLDNSLSMLSEVNTIERILNVVRDRRQEGLQEKSFWIIERFLMRGDDKSTSDISRDRSLHSALVSAIHHGDGNTKQMAERILIHLNKMPNFSITN